MSSLTHVPVGALNFERFESVLPGDAYDQFRKAAEHSRRLFAGRVVWNVNSNARGGGVAEMLVSLLAYARGAGVDARWVVISGNDPFFALTKRIHNNLHGSPGDGGDLDDDARRVYEGTTAANAEELRELVQPDDRMILQVSRWDALKDPLGVIVGFAEHIAPREPDVHLVYAGPAVEAVSDDPEGGKVLSDAQDAFKTMPDDVAQRVHLAALPMDDAEENAAIVNALQRRAGVVVQKSIAEGFGLTAAQERVRGQFLGTRSLMTYLQLSEKLISKREGG